MTPPGDITLQPAEPTSVSYAYFLFKLRDRGRTTPFAFFICFTSAWMRFTASVRQTVKIGWRAFFKMSMISWAEFSKKTFFPSVSR